MAGTGALVVWSIGIRVFRYIITTEPNELLQPIHDRMPVILAEGAESLWLDDGLRDPGLLGSVLSPYPADLMEAYRVCPLVNRPSNDGPEVIVPEGEEIPQSRSGQANLQLFQLPPAWSRRLPRAGSPSRLRHPAHPPLPAFSRSPKRLRSPGLMTAAH